MIEIPDRAPCGSQEFWTMGQTPEQVWAFFKAHQETCLICIGLNRSVKIEKAVEESWERNR